MKSMIAVLLLASAYSSAGTGDPARFDWPAPKGWKTETIPFPLEFAPEIRHDGVEELRFAPNFFKPDAPGYWSYAFAWWLKDDSVLDSARLSSELTKYFEGLSLAVGEKKFHFDRSRFKAAVVESNGHFEGKAELYDAFTTGFPLTLRIHGRALDCRAQGRRAILFALSPKPAQHPIWKDLEERIAGFRCSK